MLGINDFAVPYWGGLGDKTHENPVFTYDIFFLNG